MERIFNYCGKRLALSLAGLALAATGFAQSDNKPELPELIDREKEIEMALSAAPEHLRKDAAVYVLQRGGYVKAREGSNGFTCLVEREGVKDTSPHVMFYAPYMKNSDIGARPEHRGSQSQPWILNEGKPYAYIILVPKEKQ